MPTIKIGDLAKVVTAELKDYRQNVVDGLKADVRKTARECRQEVRDNSPVKSGEYKAGWATKTDFESTDDIRMTTYNKNKPQITHLLEDGHANVDGGRTEGIPHIGPAADNATQKLAERAKVRVRNG